MDYFIIIAKNFLKSFLLELSQH